MKTLLTLIFLIFFLSSCNSASGPAEIYNPIPNAEKNDEDSPLPATATDSTSASTSTSTTPSTTQTHNEQSNQVEEVDPLEEFSVIRNYFPDNISEVQFIANESGLFLLPLSFEVARGNSAQGWLSLIVEDRQFCFLGNSETMETRDGNLFTLQSETVSIETSCESEEGKKPYDQLVEVVSGDIVKLTFLGGGCSFEAASCLETEIKVRLSDYQFEKLDGLNPLELSSTRMYFPHSWIKDERSIERSGTLIIPSELNVSGNSGEGWLSLKIGGRYFCYQGNASGKKVADGDKFVLAYEKNNINEKCNSEFYTVPYDLKVEVTVGDKVELLLEGGGCSKPFESCLTTEVLIDLSEYYVRFI